MPTAPPTAEAVRTTLPPTARPLGLVVATAAGLAVAVAAPAAAHVELDATATDPGSATVLTFAVGHGCAGSPTTVLTVTTPPAVLGVTPTAKPGWDVTRAATADGGTAVTWTAQTPLPADLRDTFALAAVVSPEAAAGDVLALPATQTCVDGSTAWDQLPADGAEPEHPAPVLTVTAAADDALATGTAAAGGTATAAPPTGDGGARALGAGGLLVGVLGLVLATVAVRRAQDGTPAAGGPR